MTATDRALARIQRGPCGGWHWLGEGRNHHAWHCGACIALGGGK